MTNEDSMTDDERAYQARIVECEQIAASQPGDLDAALDLMYVCGVTSDPGVAGYYHLSARYCQTTIRRMDALMVQAKREHPTDCRLEFWDQYFGWMWGADKLDRRACGQMLEKHPDLLDIAIFLFSTSQGKEARQLAALGYLRYQHGISQRAKHMTRLARPAST